MPHLDCLSSVFVCHSEFNFIIYSRFYANKISGIVWAIAMGNSIGQFWSNCRFYWSERICCYYCFWGFCHKNERTGLFYYSREGFIGKLLVRLGRYLNISGYLASDLQVLAILMLLLCENSMGMKIPSLSS